MALILVIDDESQSRLALRVMLEAAGHQVLEAADGAEGVKKIQRRQGVAVVFCDLFMPGQEGLETIRQLRRQAGEVTIVAVSGGGYHGTVDCLPAARMLGATRTLKKPFGVEALLAVLAEVLPPPEGPERDR